MCQSIAEGGQRCAAHTRPRYQTATFGTPEWDEAAAAYASTPTGRVELASSLAAAQAAGDVASEVAFEHAISAGQRLREKAELFRAELDNRATFAPVEPEPAHVIDLDTPSRWDTPDDREETHWDDYDEYYGSEDPEDAAEGTAWDTGWSPSMSAYTWDTNNAAFQGCTPQMSCDQFIDQVCENTGITRAEFESAAAAYLSRHEVVFATAGDPDGGQRLCLGGVDHAAMRNLVAIAAMPRITPEEIRQIAHNARRARDESARATEAEAQSAAAENAPASPARTRRRPDLPDDPDALSRLSFSEDPTVRAAVAAHPNTRGSVLERLLNSDPKVEVRAAAARHENTPIQAVVALRNDRSIKVRAGVARNPNLPVEHLRALASDTSDTVKGAVARNPATPTDLYTDLAASRSAEVRKHAACRANIPAEVVSALAADPGQQVRSTLARNRTTDIQTLRILCRDEAQSVRAAAVRNPNFPASLLKGRVARDTAPGVRAAVARNENTPAGTIARLANDPDAWVRRNVAWNSTTPAVVLCQLLNDPDEGVRTSARDRREESGTTAA